MQTTFPALAERFAVILDELFMILMTRTDPARFEGAVLVPVFCLVGLMRKRLGRIAARLASGKPKRAKPAAAEAAPQAQQAPGAPPRRRRGFGLTFLEAGYYDRIPPWVNDHAGWLTELAPEAADCADQLRDLLAAPGLAALAAAEPGITRLLRAACRMLGVDPKPALPSRVRPKPPRRAAVYLPMHYGLGPPPKWASKRGMLVRRANDPD